MRRWMLIGVALVAVPVGMYLLGERLKSLSEPDNLLPDGSGDNLTDLLLPEEERQALLTLRTSGVRFKSDRDWARITELKINKGTSVGTETNDGLMEQVGRFRHVRKLTLVNLEVTHRGLAHLAALTELEELWLDFISIDDLDAGLQHLKGLARLRELSLTGAHASASGLANLKDLPNLEDLSSIDGKGLPGLRGIQSLKTLRVSSVDDQALEHIATMPNLVELRLASARFTDAGLASLGQLKRLRKLIAVDACGFSGAGLKRLTPCVDLEELDLTGSGVDIAGLAQLPPLPSLRKLKLWRNAISDAGMAQLAACPNLEYLDLGGCPGVTDAGARHLAGLHKLKYLSLYGTGVSDAGMSHLRGLVQLKELVLPEAGTFTDAGLRHLKELTQLEKLDLSNTKITDEGLLYLQGMRHMKSLSLWETRITEAGVRDLRRALPKAEIHGGPSRRIED